MLRPGTNGVARDLGAVEHLDARAGRVLQHDQVLHVPLVGERARAARDLHAGALRASPRAPPGGRVRDLPAEKADALPAVGVDDDALLAVVHAERHRGARLVDALQPEEVRAELRPVAELLGAKSDIAQCLHAHAEPRRSVRSFDHASRADSTPAPAA